MCDVCLTKYQAKKRGVTVRPLVFSQLNDRVQIDLIDFQSRPDGDFKFILNYQDHVTKFVVLRPLKQKTAAEVAHLFTWLGCPSVLQSDNGREFCNSIINSLRELYPDLKIVHGSPRHSQSQGSVENANKQVQRILETELLERRTTRWVTLLPFVQLKENTAYHEAIKMSPYEAVFGRSMKTGLGSTLPPTLVPSLGTLRTEEQLVQLLESIQVPEPAPSSARPSTPEPAPSSARPSTPEPAPSTPDSIPSPAGV
ncbi:hypothetical protein ONE63_005150 [Megalurothrips usitatus]|uniref:Integrase catalytic domain-containing protein n=1 Tax=Megalurothrips usitatus TaxID=439358 RepID=A0AAV7XYL2_9NEOP|nr:hypothetical protein ONE63_005150 [Megalurothrips usitatus]